MAQRPLFPTLSCCWRCWYGPPLVGLGARRAPPIGYQPPRPPPHAISLSHYVSHRFNNTRQIVLASSSPAERCHNRVLRMRGAFRRTYSRNRRTSSKECHFTNLPSTTWATPGLSMDITADVCWPGAAVIPAPALSVHEVELEIVIRGPASGATRPKPPMRSGGRTARYSDMSPESPNSGSRSGAHIVVSRVRVQGLEPWTYGLKGPGYVSVCLR